MGTAAHTSPAGTRSKPADINDIGHDIRGKPKAGKYLLQKAGWNNEPIRGA
jgi:hypothetical protein